MVFRSKMAPCRRPEPRPGPAFAGIPPVEDVMAHTIRQPAGALRARASTG
jgi:hypothetical protein